MIDFAKKLYDDLLLKLQQLEGENEMPGDAPQLAVDAIETAISRIKEELKDYSFRSVEEEVEFFKSAMPMFLFLLIYHRERIEMESTEIMMNRELREGYFKHLFFRINEFYKENAKFLRYFRSGKTNLDEYYFLRRGLLNQEYSDLLTDPAFCNIYSVKLATQQAYALLERDIRNQFGSPQDGKTPAAPSGARLEWTDSKTDMIELIYSLEANGTFNGGKADIKDITECFENVFSIRLGNTSSAFQQILCRKKGYTIYIDKLRDGLLRRIDDIESRNIR
jgi:hypothetical protein